MALPILAIIAAALAAKQSEDQKQQGLAAQSAQAAAANKEAGINMQAVAPPGTTSKTEGDNADFVTQFLGTMNNNTGGEPASKINQALDIANAETGEPAPIEIPTDDLETTQIPELPEGGLNPDEGGMFSDMSTSDKMALAASIGSMLRGPGAPPPPSRAGAQGINMQPVSLRSLYGRR